jgi:hypothetical protein
VSDYYVEEIGMALDGIVCADRSAAGLPMIADPVRGDLDVVLSLRKEAAALCSEVESVRALTDAMRTDNVRLRSEVERLRKLSDALEKYGSSRKRALRGCRIDCEKLTAEVERLRLRPEEVRFLLGVKNFFNVLLVNDLLQRHGGGE